MADSRRPAVDAHVSRICRRRGIWSPACCAGGAPLRDRSRPPRFVWLRAPGRAPRHGLRPLPPRVPAGIDGRRLARRARQSRELCEWLWHPLAIAALNQSPDVAAARRSSACSASCSARAPRTPRSACPPCRSTSCTPSRRATFIEARGGPRLRRRGASRSMSTDGRRVRGVRTRDELIDTDAVISAVPWHAFGRLWDGGVPDGACDRSPTRRRGNASSPDRDRQSLARRPVMTERRSSGSSTGRCTGCSTRARIFGRDAPAPVGRRQRRRRPRRARTTTNSRRSLVDATCDRALPAIAGPASASDPWSCANRARRSRWRPAVRRRPGPRRHSPASSLPATGPTRACPARSKARPSGHRAADRDRGRHAASRYTVARHRQMRIITGCVFRRRPLRRAGAEGPEPAVVPPHAGADRFAPRCRGLDVADVRADRRPHRHASRARTTEWAEVRARLARCPASAISRGRRTSRPISTRSPTPSLAGRARPAGARVFASRRAAPTSDFRCRRRRSSATSARRVQAATGWPVNLSDPSSSSASRC